MHVSSVQASKLLYFHAMPCPSSVAPRRQWLHSEPLSWVGRSRLSLTGRGTLTLTLTLTLTFTLGRGPLTVTEDWHRPAQNETMSGAPYAPFVEGGLSYVDFAFQWGTRCLRRISETVQCKRLQRLISHGVTWTATDSLLHSA